MYRQKSKWATRSIVCTILVTALFLSLGYYFFVNVEETLGACWLLVLAAMCFSALCFYPMEVKVGDGKLEIAFSLRNKTIPLKKITKAEPYQVTMNFVRTFGSGAFFGWWGWFRNQELGRFMVYATELDHVFLIELENGKKYVISCNNPKAMCDAINSTRQAAQQ